MDNILKNVLRTSPVLIPFIIGSIKYRHLNKGLRVFYYLTCFWTLSEIAGKALKFSGHENIWMLNIYIPVEFSIFGLMYAWFLKPFVHPRYIYLIIGVFICYSLFHTFYYQDFHEMNSYVRGPAVLVYAIFAVLYFYKILNSMEVEKLSKDPFVWINSAILLYAATLFFYFILFDYFLTHGFFDKLNKLSVVQVIFTALFYIIASVGLLKVKRK